MELVHEKLDLGALRMPPAAAQVRKIVDGFKAYQVLRAGYQTGLFDWLVEHGPAEKAALGAALHLRGAHLGAFLQALEDLGLLVHCGDLYGIGEGMKAVLSSASPWCQAQVLDQLGIPDQGWFNMPTFLSESWLQPTQSLGRSLALHPYFTEAQQFAAVWTQRTQALDVLACRRSGPRLLLCFDGSDGLLAATLCQRDPDLQATVVVAPSALRRTQHVLAECGMVERCKLQTGTPLDATAWHRHDEAVLFHCLYAVRKSVSDALRVAASVLPPGGGLASAHWFCNEACVSAPGGLRDLDKAVLTDSHPLCGIEKFPQRLLDAGLADAEARDMQGFYGSTKLHFAQRPGGGCFDGGASC